ncbi:MAG: membrane protein insertion efficiency factor YidD [Patescibacteria group bacterium]
MTNLILLAIAAYKKISLMLRVTRIPIFIYTDCKFTPSCSDYAAESIKKHGALRGSARSVIRVFKCSPFSKGGVDLP